MARLKDRVKAKQSKPSKQSSKLKSKLVKRARQAPMANWSRAEEKAESAPKAAAKEEAPVLVKQVKDDPQAAKLEKALAANAKQSDELTRLRKENESLNVLRNSLEQIGKNHAEVGDQLRDAVAKSNA